MTDLIEGMEGGLKERYHNPQSHAPQPSISFPVPLLHSSLGITIHPVRTAIIKQASRQLLIMPSLGKDEEELELSVMQLEGKQTWYSHFGERQPHS